MPEPMVGQVAQVVETVEHALCSDLLGLYLYGSAARSGLQPDSDLDFLAVVSVGLSADTRQRLVDALLRLSGRWPRRGPERPVELTVVVRDEVVPWRYPPRIDFVYGEWLRDQMERGVLPSPEPDPDLTILLGMVRDVSVALIGPPARHLLDPVPAHDMVRAIAATLPTLIDTIAGDERNVVLTLARMWITAESGTVLSKADAAAALAPRLPAPHAQTLRAARAAYLGTADWVPHTDAVLPFVHYAEQRIRAACAEPRSPVEPRPGTR